MRAARALPLVLGLTALVVVVTTPSAVARADREVHDQVHPRREEGAAAQDHVDRLPVSARQLSRRRVPDRRQSRLRQPPTTVRVRRRRPRRGHEDRANRLSRHVVALTGTPRVHSPSDVAGREQADRDEDRGRAGAGGTGSTRRARRNLAAHCADRGPADRGALYTETAPAGQYTMVVDRRFVQHRGPAGCRRSRAITSPAQEPSPSARRCGHSSRDRRRLVRPVGTRGEVCVVGEWQHADACAGRRIRRVQQARRDLHR